MRSSSTNKTWKAVEPKSTTELRVINDEFDLEPKPADCESPSAIAVDVEETAKVAAKHALDEFQNGRITNAVDCLARASTLCTLSPVSSAREEPGGAGELRGRAGAGGGEGGGKGPCSAQLSSTIAAWHRLFAPLSLENNQENSNGHRLLHNFQGIKAPDIRKEKEGGGGGFGAVWEGGTEEVMVWDGAVSGESCSVLIDMFEKETQQQGGVVKGGHVVEDARVKRDLEISVNNASLTDPRWGKVERLLFGLLAKHFSLYQQRNPGLRLLRSPLSDEGFRMKKYRAAPDFLHNYHLDSGDEGGGARRVVAWLLYLNDVHQGGETVFLSQGLRVSPRCGRVLMFPTSFSFVHAGYPPISGDKYNVISFVTIPN